MDRVACIGEQSFSDETEIFRGVIPPSPRALGPMFLALKGDRSRRDTSPQKPGRRSILPGHVATITTNSSAVEKVDWLAAFYY
ncbi:hypothetical protein [Rhizobium leguminosarum]|uniref:hypothetical protein n=1 Tax=Rhizobium leguminosarum TaxID=384 RepID=UPI0012BC2C19|nr:hypothetical protein [Rhizobium leguminosarum]